MEVENRLTFLSCLLNKRTQSIRKQNKVTIHYQLLNLLFRKKWHDHFCFFQYTIQSCENTLLVSMEVAMFSSAPDVGSRQFEPGYFGLVSVQIEILQNTNIYFKTSLCKVIKMWWEFIFVHYMKLEYLE